MTPFPVTKVTGALLVVEIIHGAYAVIAKLLFDAKIHPILFVFLRSLVALPLLTLLARLDSKGKKVLPQTSSEWQITLILGLTGVTGNLVANAGGILLTESPFKASLFQQLIPVITISIAALQGRENVNPMNRCGALKWCWILVAVSGAFMVITLNSKDNFTNPPWSTLGDGLLIVNIVSYSTYLTFVGPLLSVYPPVLLTCWTYISGTALNAVCLVIAYAFWGKDVLIFSVKGIYGVLYGGVLSSTVAYLLINWTNQVTSPPVVTAFVPLQTVVAAGLSAVVFGEDVGWREVVGGIICCVGVFGLVYIRWRETILGSDLCSEEESRRRDRIATIDEVDENQASEETPLLNS